MTTQAEIVAAIAKHLAITPQDIDLAASLAEDLGLGPLERADLLADLSEQFGVTFNPTEVEGIDSVHDLVVMIEDLLIEE